MWTGGVGVWLAVHRWSLDGGVQGLRGVSWTCGRWDPIGSNVPVGRGGAGVVGRWSSGVGSCRWLSLVAVREFTSRVDDGVESRIAGQRGEDHTDDSWGTERRSSTNGITGKGITRKGNTERGIN